MAVWTLGSCPLNGPVGGCWSPDLSLFVMVGYDGGGGHSIATSPDGIVWTGRGNPGGWDGYDAVWAAGLSKFFAAGQNGGTKSIVKSSNGTTWTTSLAGYAQAIEWSEEQGILMAGTLGGATAIYTSSDGVTWTPQPSAFDGGAIAIGGLAYSPELNLWVAVGYDTGSALYLATSPDGATWTSRVSPLDLALTCAAWCPEISLFVVGGINSAFTLAIQTSPDGINWTTQTCGFEGSATQRAIEAGSTLIIGGTDGGFTIAVATSTDGSAYTPETTPFDGFGQALGFAYSPELEMVVAFGDFAGVMTSIGWTPPTPPPPPPPTPSARFYTAPPWMFLVTDLDHVTTVYAQDVITSRNVTFLLDQATVLAGAVWPDDRRVNELHTDGYPRIAQNKRFVYAFERVGGTPPWIPQAAGLLMTVQDEGDADQPLTHFTAYDQWKLLEARPCMNDAGELPGNEGFVYANIPGNEIALELLKNTIDFEGTVHIDAGVAFGGTAFYGGTIETTPGLFFTAGYGEMVADVWNRLCQTGTMDIELRVIYDPINRPGYTHELSIYALAGGEQPTAVFGWGMLNRSVTKIDRMHDGTPGSFFNKVQYHAGQGGPPVPLAGPLENALSIAAFGSYWAQQFFVDQTSVDETAGAVLALAEQALEMAKQGRRTMTLQLTPERAPIPLSDYRVGDRVPIYAPQDLRVSAAGYQRVHGMPIEIDDNGIPRVNALLCTPDFREVAT